MIKMKSFLTRTKKISSNNKSSSNNNNNHSENSTCKTAKMKTITQTNKQQQEKINENNKENLEDNYMIGNNNQTDGKDSIDLDEKKDLLNSFLSNDSNALEIDLINKILPKELIIRVFSYLDIISLCRCAQVSKHWNTLALDGSNWQYVDLFNFQTDVSGNVVENLAKRCNEFLKSIRLENCRWIQDDSIKKLCSECINIEVLNLKQCIKLTDNAFIKIGDNLNKLVNINLDSCSIGDNGLLAIGKGCPNLQSIDLSWCKHLSSEAIATFVSKCNELRFFSSKGLKNINNDVLKKLAKSCLNLSNICLNGCNYVSDDGMVAITTNCASLKFIGISNCTHLTDATLISLGQNCHELKILEASGCLNFSDNGFLVISKGCHDLERIDLEECSRITDATLHNFSANCFNLRHLTLSRCECITDEGIRQLGISNCAAVTETLQVLELDNCPLITDASLEQLYKCQSLLQLELYDCQLITKNGIKKLQAKLPNVKVHAYFAPPITASSQRPPRSCNCRCCTIL